MAGALHSMCELTRQGNGMGVAWERHGMCELTVELNTRLSGRHRFLETKGNYSHKLGVRRAR
jgi:hypothetical protein